MNVIARLANTSHIVKNLNRLSRNLTSVTATISDFPSSNVSGRYMDYMYEAWLNDPKSVHASWNAYFRTGNFSIPPTTSNQNLSNLISQKSAHNVVIDENSDLSPINADSDTFKSYEIDSQGHVYYYPQLAQLGRDRQIILKNIAVHLFIRSFQMRGHRWAQIDPLGLYNADLDSKKVFDLSMQLYGLNDDDLDRKFMLPASSFIGGKDLELPLKEIIKRLKRVYCSTVGLEFMYINNYEPCIWLRQQFETPEVTVLDNNKRWIALKRLIRATLLERFLNKKWPSEKRFGLEGCESVITSLKTVIDMASLQGVDTFIIGMPHRGRINVLANVTRQPLSAIFSRFHSDLEPSEISNSGDVKYHLGTVTKRLNRVSKKDISIVLSANPSHLEAVDPLVFGKCRAKQFYNNDHDGNKTMAILLHGDAAFAAQGIVYETFDLSDLPAYSPMGAVHIVINNQIGFTTDPSMARSSPYCTDVARVVNAPIFHVNGDDVDMVVNVSEVAAKWRQKFKKDVVIDVVGYRRHGHNEMDDPRFTHPHMYKAIDAQVPVMEKYADKLINEGVIEKQSFDNYVKKYQTILDDGFKLSEQQHKDVVWVDSEWPEFENKFNDEPLTGVDESTLLKIGEAYSTVPEDFSIHKGLSRILKNRQTMLSNRKLDWAIAEAMSIGSLLLDKKHVRLSGQDAERGTFSHRHHVLHDQDRRKHLYIPLNNLSTDQAQYIISNSSLNEYANLGFELGYSTEHRDSLVIWEAQFGDFANNAQCIIDQFISSGESKWNRQTGLVLLLPHAFEGSGPEHSSARIERFLQLCNVDWSNINNSINADKNFALEQLHNVNMIIANCTTPANFFHVLRRQLSLPMRKPLIVFTPKSLLRSPDAISSLDEVVSGTRFNRIIEKECVPENVKRIVLCSGHVFYDVQKKLNESNLEDIIHVIRIEQLCPFPIDLVKKSLARFPSSAQVCWLQEEHKNMGPYMHFSLVLEALLKEIRSEDKSNVSLKVFQHISYIGLGSHLQQLCHTLSNVPNLTPNALKKNSQCLLLNDLFNTQHSSRVFCDRYIGRKPSAAAATGNRIQHNMELDELLNDLIEI